MPLESRNRDNVRFQIFELLLQKSNGYNPYRVMQDAIELADRLCLQAAGPLPDNGGTKQAMPLHPAEAG